MSKGKGDTNVRLQARRVVLECNQLGSAKHHLEVGEEVTHLSFSWGYVFRASRLFEPGFLCPIQRELIQKIWIVSAAANLEELTLEALV